MAPVGDEYSSVSDGYFADRSTTQLVVETSIDVVAFWKFNVKVIHYKQEDNNYGPVNVTEYTATATSTIKDGFALYYTNFPSGSISTYLDAYVLEPASVSAHAGSYTPNLFYFNTFSFFNHRGKWYIHDPFGTPSDTLTADLSKIVIDRNFSSYDYGQRYTYTCLEPFYQLNP